MKELNVQSSNKHIKRTSTESVRFLDDNSVLINAASAPVTKREKEFELTLQKALLSACLQYIEIPSNSSGNSKNMEAKGKYLNYLQMENVIILPVFHIKEDRIVEQKFKELFPDFKIATVNSNEIARDGGTNKYYPFVFTFGYSF